MTGTDDRQAQPGRLEPTGDGRHRLVFSRTLPHPPTKVWRALTEPDEVKAWFPSEIRGERAVGAPLRFVFDGDEEHAIAGEVLVYEPPSRLELRWDDEVLRFELEATSDGEGTRLTFVNTIGELGKGARDAAGWHVCLEVLAHRLDGAAVPWESRQRWDEVHPAYVDAFGPEASAIGPPTV